MESRVEAVLERLLQPILEKLDQLVQQRASKEWYSTHEVAEIVGKAEYTVREWSRKGQVKAEKAPNGRSWIISHAELTRLRNHGPLPEHQLHRLLGG